MLNICNKMLRRFTSDKGGRVELETSDMNLSPVASKCLVDFDSDPDISKEHELEHRALIYLMTQKTDSVLGALANTIEQERQKLGIVVRKPSKVKTVDLPPSAALDDKECCFSVYDRIMPLIDEGFTVSKIARKLELPELEISMVMRLNAS